MKKTMALVITLALLLPMSCAKKEKAGLSTLVPANTQVYMKIPPLTSLHQNLNVTENSIMGKTIPNIAFLEAGLGINPLILEDLKAQGIDVDSELGLILYELEINSINNKEPDINAQGMLLFPVSDYEKFIGFIQDTIQKINPELELVQENDRTLIKPGTDKESILLAPIKNYLAVTVTKSENGSSSLLDTVLSGDSTFSENENFQLVKSKLDKDDSLFVYADIHSFIGKFLPKLAQFTDELPEAQKSQMKQGLEFTRDYISAGISFDLDSSDFRLDSLLTLKPESKVLKMMDNVEFNKDLLLGIDKTPLLIFSFAFNFREYVNLIMGTIPPESKEIFEETTKKFYEQIGLDLEKDILDNMAGSFNLGIFDGENINITNTNTLMSIGIKDETKATNMMDTMIENLPSQQQALIQKEEIVGTDAYVASAGFFQIFTGIKNNSTFMTIGQPMFETVVSGKSSSGFTSKIQDNELAEILSGDYSYFYVNIDELMKAQKNLSNFIGFLSQMGSKISDIASQFEYLLSYSSIEDSSLFSEIIIKTRFDKPFLQGIMDIFSQINN